MDNISAGGTIVRSELRVSCCPASLSLPRAWTVVLVRVGLYFLIPFKQCFITISRVFLRVYTRFLSYVLSGSREWEKFFIVLDFLF
jgi:hypothetical protein